MLERLLKEWDFLSGLICTGGNNDRRDAEDVLGLLARTLGTELEYLGNEVHGQIIAIKRFDVSQPTIWWSEATRLFAFGLVSDDEGSIFA